jgi:hypothetical protein
MRIGIVLSPIRFLIWSASKWRFLTGSGSKRFQSTTLICTTCDKFKTEFKNLQGGGGTVACIRPADPLLHPSLGHLAAVYGNGNAHALTRQEQLVAHDKEAVIAVEDLCPGPTKRLKLNILQNRGREIFEFCYF